ncbi:GPI mannosyltransferase 1 [Diatrype stigma]|uniref:GPI mannosyltransferase 1 n=1 Tax=Diatrype stigma TaxID=117547 RepID=A0AAN9VB63_9PEZI
MASLFSRPLPLFAAAALLRAVMLVYGLWQDANSPLKYTDIDYMVFTDAARFTFSPPSLSSSSTSPFSPASPYTRETYRYTPLLAWLLWPTTIASGSSAFWFSWGKILFAVADLLAGWLLVLILRYQQQQQQQQRGVGRKGVVAPAPAPGSELKYAAIWLLNPMVATISTRGSSEGLLGVLVTALLWASLARRSAALAGALLGLGVHFKIYPFIYAPAVAWWWGDADDDDGRSSSSSDSNNKASNASAATPGGVIGRKIAGLLTPARLTLAGVSLATFLCLNAAMYALYGSPFVVHTFLHHVSRVDHRHNFSPYNVLLYLASAESPSSSSSSSSFVAGTAASAGVGGGIGIESLAFLPQLLLSTVLIPLVGARKDLPTTMLAQTFAFVTFNKVCTSQYFLWYMVLLPLYLPRSSLVRHPRRGLTALALWVAGQALWLQQGYGLEFLGHSTFVPGLWAASLAFFLVNCWILGIIIGDLEVGVKVEDKNQD